MPRIISPSQISGHIETFGLSFGEQVIIAGATLQVNGEYAVAVMVVEEVGEFSFCSQ